MAIGTIRTAETLERNNPAMASALTRTRPAVTSWRTRQMLPTASVKNSAVHMSDVARGLFASIVGQSAQSSNDSSPPAAPNRDRDQKKTTRQTATPNRAAADRPQRSICSQRFPTW